MTYFMVPFLFLNFYVRTSQPFSSSSRYIRAASWNLRFRYCFHSLFSPFPIPLHYFASFFFVLDLDNLQTEWTKFTYPNDDNHGDQGIRTIVKAILFFMSREKRWQFLGCMKEDQEWLYILLDPPLRTWHKGSVAEAIVFTVVSSRHGTRGKQFACC